MFIATLWRDTAMPPRGAMRDVPPIALSAASFQDRTSRPPIGSKLNRRAAPTNVLVALNVGDFRKRKRPLPRPTQGGELLSV